MNDGARYLARVAARRRDRLSGEEEPVRRNSAPEEWRAVGNVPGARTPHPSTRHVGAARAGLSWHAASPAGRRAPAPRRNAWGGRRFRFRLASFRLGEGLSTRRFSVTEAAFLLILAYLTSKGLGVVRQTLFNALFGMGAEATAYYAAFSLPDALFNLIAGGALTSAFIPVFLSYEKAHGERDVWRLTSLVFNVLLVGLVVLVLVAELLAPSFVTRILVPGLPPAERDLTTTLTRIMLVHALILGLGTIATAVLGSKRQFLLPALAMALYDVGVIGGLLVSLAVPRVGIYGPTYGLLASAVCQVAVLLPGLHKQGARYTLLWDLRHPGLREVLRLLVPNVLAVGIASTGVILETTFASSLPDPASLAALRNASLLFALPVTFVAQVIGQALLPHLTTQATSGRYVRLSQTLVKMVGAAVLLSALAAIVLALFGRAVIVLVFQHGAFDPHSSSLTALALLGYAVGLPGVVAGQLLVLSFYALKEARTPLLTNLATLGMRIGLILLLLKGLTGPSALLALPLAASVSGTLEAVLLGLLLFRRVRARVKTDRGMQRLRQRRASAQPAALAAPVLKEAAETSGEGHTGRGGNAPVRDDAGGSFAGPQHEDGARNKQHMVTPRMTGRLRSAPGGVFRWFHQGR